MVDHYQTLGLQRDATKDEVKAAFRSRALRDHPDRHGGSTEAARNAAAQRFRQASDAYHVLSDDRRRAEYDFRLRSSSSSYARTSSSGWASSSSSSSSSSGSYGYGYSHGGGSYRRPPSGSSVGSVDWEFVLKRVTRPGFLINLAFAGVLVAGATFLDGSILEIWNMNNSGKSFEDAMDSIDKVKKTQKGNRLAH
ncbi:hypothetical protein EJB05_32400 [Eragrostis curvula]|uniref:J domain-containing protein n=1 Tax=Eragrostis curvula TaxID=38414 RepID=A0A5J9UG11_9POAL|nr:hypothetical protein EJB05_32400 [Eragrostis curvula]